MQKNLCMSKKSSIFAAQKCVEYEKKYSSSIARLMSGGL